jgi:hypothetical protein
MVDPDAPQVFISYARQDGTDIKELLRRRLPDLLPGWRIWTDDLMDASGPPFTLQIQRAIDASAISLFVLTEAGSESEWCEREVARAPGHATCGMR